MIRKHAKAVKLRLQQAQAMAEAVFEGNVTDRPELYASFFLRMTRISTRYTGKHASYAGTVTIHSVGQTVEQAQYVQERVQQQLVDHALIVEGRSCKPLEHVHSGYPELDRDVDPPLYVAADQFDFVSEPAA